MHVSSPVARCEAVYRTEPCARSFAEDLEAHLLHGYVFSTPDYFVMGRAVCKDAPHADIVNPWVNFPSGDCWHLYLFAGPMQAAFDCAPYPLNFVSFERRNLLRVYEIDRIRRRCINGFRSLS
jgi:hypothetical protein